MAEQGRRSYNKVEDTGKGEVEESVGKLNEVEVPEPEPVIIEPDVKEVESGDTLTLDNIEESIKSILEMCMYLRSGDTLAKFTLHITQAKGYLDDLRLESVGGTGDAA